MCISVLDGIVASLERLADKAGDPSCHAAVATQLPELIVRLKGALAEEREATLENEAFGLLEEYAETPATKLTESAYALKRKLLSLGSSSSRQNHGRFQSYESALSTYIYETGNIVYDRESFEKFGKWLYRKKCDDECPFCRVVEGEGECRPRCTNPLGHCSNNEEAS